MSRSFKKSPTIIGRLKAANHKRLANKRIRKETDVPDGMSYKKVYETDNVKDFTSGPVSLESLLKAYETDTELQARFATSDELVAYWKLNYIGK